MGCPLLFLRWRSNIQSLNLLLLGYLLFRIILICPTWPHDRNRVPSNFGVKGQGWMLNLDHFLTKTIITWQYNTQWQYLSLYTCVSNKLERAPTDIRDKGQCQTWSLNFASFLHSNSTIYWLPMQGHLLLIIISPPPSLLTKLMGHTGFTMTVLNCLTDLPSICGKSGFCTVTLLGFNDETLVH